MARNWTSTFEAWGAPPSQAEQDRIARTEREVRTALAGFTRLGDRKYSVYPKGSHRRGTNVRLGSDVDMAVELRGTTDRESFQYDKYFAAEGLENEALGMVDIPQADVAKLSHDTFKRDVYDALVASYGTSAVEWSNKCIKVREGKTTLPVDVVPCRYYRRYDSKDQVNEGVQIWPDKGSRVVNWPRQDDDDGTTKNIRTSYRYKKAVRGIKALENEMTDKGVLSEVPSFLVECAMYNVPDSLSASPSNYQNCLNVLGEWARAVTDRTVYEEWVEVNELKYLIRPTQTWTIDDMVRLVDHAIDYLGTA